MKPIYLTGFMGAGKTTIGKELGKRLSMKVIDTDALIETMLQKSITDIFSENGEEFFRDYETRVIRSNSRNNVIITTGGGIVQRRENREWMEATGLVIYLHCDPNTIVERLVSDKSRPLLKNNKNEQIKTLFEKRLPYYLEADYTVNTTMKTTEMVVQEIDNFLDRYAENWA